jgi:hypothetical protein
MRAADYRVPAGHCALTIDLAGLTPTTLLVEEGKLTAYVEGVDRVLASMSYVEFLHLFIAQFRAAKEAADDEAVCAALTGWWLVLRHPALGADMANATSDMMARGEPVHATVHIGTTGGLTFALGAQFIDLDKVAEHAERMTLPGVFVINPDSPGPDRTRQ